MKVNADAWKEWYYGKEEIIDENMPKLEKIFRENKITRILDLGCGTGRHTVYFAERRFDVYGFDFSPYAVEHATKNLKKRNLSAQLMVWDMSKEFPYRNEFFDAVITIRVIHHAPVKVIKHVVSEISRITKRGGYLFAQVPTYERNIKYQTMGVKRAIIEPGTHIPLEGPEKGIPHHGFKQQEISDLLNDFNFDIMDINERDEHYNVLASKR